MSLVTHNKQLQREIFEYVLLLMSHMESKCYLQYNNLIIDKYTWGTIQVGFQIDNKNYYYAFNELNVWTVPAIFTTGGTWTPFDTDYYTEVKLQEILQHIGTIIYNDPCAKIIKHPSA